MKLFTKGGKIINRGYKGIVMDLYNKDKDDTNSLYNELKTANPDNLKLISIDETFKIPKNEIENVLKLMKTKADKTLVKKFVYVSLFFGSNEKHFKNELDGYKQLISIFGKDISKYTTVKRGFEYNNKDIYGISFNDNYYIFLEKCYKTLENIQFTPKTLHKCVKEIIEMLDIMRTHNYIHNDIKPDNIILCKNRFKLIDWESSNFIKNQASTFINSKNGNLVFNHPIKFYRIGVPYSFYRYIYDAEMHTYDYLTDLNSPTVITDLVYDSFNQVVDRYNKKGSSKDKDFYLKMADYYSFALVVIYMAEKNKIDYPKKVIDEILANYFIKK